MIAWLAIALLSAPADFDPASQAWNGLDYLPTTAKEARVVVEPTESLDWSSLSRDQVLVLAAPAPGIDPQQVVRFVQDGGHVVVAVDVGSDPALPAAFGLRVATEPVIHDDYHGDHPSFPRLSPPEEAQPHFLWYNVDEIVLNHPVALEVAGARRRSDPKAQVIVPFAEPGQVFAVEVEAGEGFALFLSDSSVFINDMQRHAYGDKQFVANVLRYYCEDECSATLVLPWAEHTGRYRPELGSGLGGLERIVGLAIDELDSMAASIGEVLGSEEVLFALSVALLAALLFGSALLPWPRAIRRFPWQLAPLRARTSDVEYRARALARARSRADFSVAAKALHGRFEAALAGKSPRGRAALRCQETFNKVRHSATDGPRPGLRVTLQEFERLWDDCEAALGPAAEGVNEPAD